MKDLTLTAKDVGNKQLSVEVTDEAIPYHKLGPGNPITHFGQLYLFECDLEDCGYTMAETKFRMMKDSWFVLIRYYLRVDNVVVRIFDTRLYHELGSNYILREFKHQECDFATLKESGFHPTSDWMLSPTQADQVAKIMGERLKITEKLLF